MITKAKVTDIEAMNRIGDAYELYKERLRKQGFIENSDSEEYDLSLCWKKTEMQIK